MINSCSNLLNIHENIVEKLKYFHKVQKIPNIIFHGQSGSGKKTLLSDFIKLIYGNDKEKIKKYVLYTNCAHGGKGIKFIREELKFFAKMHINSNGGNVFKSIVLLNADKLTIDAQSALRRCIELFTHSTRFFIIVEDKYKLLKPILSRFCEIYVSPPIIQGNEINLYTYNLNETFKIQNLSKKRLTTLKTLLTSLNSSSSCDNVIEQKDIINLTNTLYEKAYSGIEICKFIESNYTIFNLDQNKKNELLFTFYKIRKEFRNEKILIFFILHFLYIDKEISLENISFF
jgi:DNA polymerase III delta prime subunit